MQIAGQFADFADMSLVSPDYLPFKGVGTGPLALDKIGAAGLVYCESLKVFHRYMVDSNKFGNQMVEVLNHLDKLFREKISQGSKIDEQVYAAVVNYFSLIKKASPRLESLGVERHAVPSLLSCYRNWFRICVLAEILGLSEVCEFQISGLRYLVAQGRFPCRYTPRREFWYY